MIFRIIWAGQSPTAVEHGLMASIQLTVPVPMTPARLCRSVK